jgi:hypothetical protein
MCYTCGCKLPYEDHGDPKNIIEDHLRNAGQTEDIDHAGKVKAKKNMMELLDLEEKAGDLENPKKDYNK